MNKVYVVAVVDGGDFDRVIEQRVFADRTRAMDWAQAEAQLRNDQEKDFPQYAYTFEVMDFEA